MPFSYLIIDNDLENAQKTKSLFGHFPSYFCSGLVSDSALAVEQIYSSKPQLVLMTVPVLQENKDIAFTTVLEMHQYSDAVPYFIALADSDKYALQAIQSGFSDYVIKPLQIHDLGKCLFKFEKKNPISAASTICIKSFSDYNFVQLSEVLYLKADNTTTDFIMENGKTINAFKVLKHFEENLPINFLRIHKSYIVNINFVDRIYFMKSKCFMTNGISLPFSSTYKENIEEIVHRIDM